MKVFYSDHLLVPLPSGHRFPMPKYSLLFEALSNLALMHLQLINTQPASKNELILVHSPDYVDKVFLGLLSEKEMRRIGFPWSPELVIRSLYSVGGTIMACRSALEDDIAIHQAGGTHHAYPDHGEGYCIFNDVAVAARVLKKEKKAKKIVIIDLDVHQGNGTAYIFRDDPSIFTFSVHGEKNFPFRKQKSDLDISLPDRSEDDVYLEAVRKGLNTALKQANFDIAIYIAGADPFFDDRLGRLSVSKAGLANRDKLVFEKCREKKLPIAVVLGGGYARRVEDVVAIHIQTIYQASSYVRYD